MHPIQPDNLFPPTFDGRPWPVCTFYSLEDWKNFQPFPGHRNSEKRSLKATHLFILRPEHIIVEAARLIDSEGKPYLDANGREMVYRLTGNTRVAVWERGASDRVPSHVMATVFGCQSLDEVTVLGSHFDSKQASWTPVDQAYRSNGIAFLENWRPKSSTFLNNSVAVFSGLRQAHAITEGNVRPLPSRENENILPLWLEEYQTLDSILEMKFAPNLKNKGVDQAAVMAAFFLLLRIEDHRIVRAFITQVLLAQGTRTEKGYDGVQLAIDSIYPSGNRRTEKMEITDNLISAFLLWKTEKRQSDGVPPPINLVELIRHYGK